ncbi:hypothetical protein ACFV5K_18005, partial [Streptomyces sp. NPDC059744]
MSSCRTRTDPTESERSAEPAGSAGSEAPVRPENRRNSMSTMGDGTRAVRAGLPEPEQYEPTLPGP